MDKGSALVVPGEKQRKLRSRILYQEQIRFNASFHTDGPQAANWSLTCFIIVQLKERAKLDDSDFAGKECSANFPGEKLV